MKHKIILLSSLLCASFLINSSVLATSLIAPNYTNYKNVGNYVGSNFIYGGAANLVFNEFKNSFVKENLKLKDLKNKKAIDMLKSFNSAFFTNKDLDSISYYIKSGYGQKTVDLINKESRAKFPNKSFEDLDVKISKKDIISYAYFVKDLKFNKELNKCVVKFKNIDVNGFCGDQDYDSTISVVKYFDKNKFIVKLKEKNNKDEIFLMKGYDLKNPDLAVGDIKKYGDKVEFLEDGFEFQAPNINVDYTRSYKELENKTVLNSKLKNFVLKIFFERIKFKMDYQGAKVENEAIIMLVGLANPTVKYPKELYFNNDFFIVMKQKDSSNPCFILGVGDDRYMR